MSLQEINLDTAHWEPLQDERKRLEALLLEQHQVRTDDFMDVLEEAVQERADHVNAGMVDHGIGLYEYGDQKAYDRQWELEAEGDGTFEVKCSSLDFEGPESGSGSLSVSIEVPRPRSSIGGYEHHDILISYRLLSYTLGRRVLQVQDGDTVQRLVVWNHHATYEWEASVP